LEKDKLNFQYEKIVSFSNPKIKKIKKLWVKKTRDTERLFIIENYRELLRAFNNNITIRSIFFCPDFFPKHHGNEIPLIKKIIDNGGKGFYVPPKIFKKIAYKDKPDGLLAIAECFQTTDKLKGIQIHENSIFVVLEGLEKPSNLGTILRSADAVSIDTVILCDPVTDIFNPNVVRTSTGTLFSIPIIEADRDELIKFFKLNRIKILGTFPDGNILYTDNVYNGPLAIILGSEQYGLTEPWRKNADFKVYIPMKGIADSLNVGMAGVLLMFESRRKNNNLKNDSASTR
jgi:TrmH family RNA methyltransferase